MYTMSSAMGKRWAEVCTEMTERIQELGPNPVRASSKRPETRGESREGAAEAAVLSGEP
jgi:hypothetical protein